MEQNDKDELLNLIIKNKEFADEVITDFENLNPDIHEEFVSFRHKILDIIDSDYEEKEEERNLNAPTPRVEPPAGQIHANPPHASHAPQQPPQVPSVPQQHFQPPVSLHQSNRSEHDGQSGKAMDRVVLSSSERSDFNKKLQPHPQMAVQQSGRQHNPNDSVDRQLEDMNRLINQRNQNEEQVDSRVKPVQARGSHPVELSSVLNKSQSAHHHRIISASHDEIDFDVPKERSERIGAESLDSGKPKRFEAIAQKHAEKDDPFGSLRSRLSRTSVHPTKAYSRKATDRSHRATSQSIRERA